MIRVGMRFVVTVMFAAVTFTVVHSVAGAQAATPARADTIAPAPAGSDSWTVLVLGTQINVIGQDLRPLRSPYSGAPSFSTIIEPPARAVTRFPSAVAEASSRRGAIEAGSSRSASPSLS